MPKRSIINEAVFDDVVAGVCHPTEANVAVPLGADTPLELGVEIRYTPASDYEAGSQSLNTAWIGGPDVEVGDGFPIVRDDPQGGVILSVGNLASVYVVVHQVGEGVAYIGG